jgi:hypothetical protein
MMAHFLGFVPLGNTLTTGFVTTSTSNVPTNADSAPAMRTYGPSGNISAGNVTATALDQANVTGLYSFSIVASGANGFTQGQTYTVVAKYAVGGQGRADILTFTVV